MVITIYLNQERTSVHVIRPTKKFGGDIEGLVKTVAPGYYSYKVES